METKQIVDVRDVILEHLEKIERPLAWLVRQVNIPYGTLYSILIEKRIPLNEERLQLINTALGTDFKQS